MSLRIVGAGLAGLLAAHAWPQARLFEAAPGPHAAHKALLRFRSDAVARLTGIDFHPVTVRKGIWFGGKFVQPSIGMANLYAQKVTGALTGDRSIWNLEPVERWIAPEDFYEQLLENVGARIEWNAPFDFAGVERPVVSTAPLPVVLKAVGMPLELKPGVNLQRQAIRVSRHRVPGANIYQTIYYPDPELQVYRASITGSLLIVEEIVGEFSRLRDWTVVLKSFGIMASTEALEKVEQQYGKIVPLPDADRRAILHALTEQHGIFSLGRFATWRNILLDDVVQDIGVLRRLMRASKYERALFAS